VIVGPQLASGKFLDLVEHFKEVMSQSIVAHGPVVTLHISVLLRLAGLDESMRMPRLAAQAKVTALMYSGPLSQRIAFGLPRHSIIRSSDLMTRSDGSEKSTSMPKPSRLKSSMTLNKRMLRPSAS